MQEVVLDGIVIGVQDYKENSKLLNILTSEGVKLAVAKGITKQTSKLKLVANPFCFAEFTLLTKNTTTLVGANVYDSFFALSANYENYVTGCAVLDLIKKTVDDGVNLKQLFLPCVKAIKDLCYSSTPALITLNNFLLLYLNVCGYLINTKTCAGCGKILQSFYFNPYEANILCEDCKHINCQKLNDCQIEYLKNGNTNNLNKQDNLLITKCLANSIFCLTNIKLKIEDLLK